MNEEKPEEVQTANEEKEYTTFALDGFRIKTGDEALQNFKDKVKGKTNSETQMQAWVQGKMRLRDPKTPAKEGSFDKAAARFLTHIFKEQLQEAKKQRKLTDTPSPIDAMTDREVAEFSKTITQGAQRCQRCHKPHSLHGVKGGKTCRNFQPATRRPGRPKAV